MRLYEALGGRARARITAAFDVEAAAVCDLLEREDSEISALAPLTVDARGLELALKPFQIVTLRLSPSSTYRRS